MKLWDSEEYIIFWIKDDFSITPSLVFKTKKKKDNVVYFWFTPVKRFWMQQQYQRFFQRWKENGLLTFPWKFIVFEYLTPICLYDM